MEKFELPEQNSPDSTERVDEKDDTGLGKKDKPKSRGKVRKIVQAAALGALLTVKDSPPVHETFEQMHDRAKRELAEGGITSEQRETYKPGVSELTHRAVYPIGIWPQNFETWMRFAEDTLRRLKEGRDENFNPGEEDAWRLYLGLPQMHDTFDVSDYRPSVSKEDKYYFKIKNFREEFGWSSEEEEKSGIEKIVEATKAGSKSKTMTRFDPLPHSQIMNNYTWGQGEDDKGHYVAYYDRYDLDVPVEKHGVVGKPFEIYDRIYFDPATFQILP